MMDDDDDDDDDLISSTDRDESDMRKGRYFI